MQPYIPFHSSKQIYGISPALLGATLLAWGNSVSDLVSNITLAQVGYRYGTNGKRCVTTDAQRLLCPCLHRVAPRLPGRLACQPCGQPSGMPATRLPFDFSPSPPPLPQDGLPSMAITACFASPMFTLLAGEVGSRRQGGILRLREQQPTWNVATQPAGACCAGSRLGITLHCLIVVRGL